ncbi:MAG TPA: sensor histidine kinase [Acetobacteraceae bacterium]|nr:sensor histidine kinase [Acetobacteraceae bacterium]
MAALAAAPDPPADAEQSRPPEAASAVPARRLRLSNGLLTRVLGLVCLALLPITVLACVIALRNHQLARALARQQAWSASAALLARAQSDATFLDRSLIDVAALPAVRGAGGGACSQALAQAMAASGGRFSGLARVVDGTPDCMAPGSDILPGAVAPLAHALAPPGGSGFALQPVGPGLLVAGRRMQLADRRPALLAASLRDGWLAPPAGAPVGAMGEMQALWLVLPDGTVMTLGPAEAGWPAPSAADRRALAASLGTPVQQALGPPAGGPRRAAWLSATKVAGGGLLVAGTVVPDDANGMSLLGGRIVEVGAMLLAGLVIGALGAAQAVVAPLARLGRALGRWRAGGPFDAGQVAALPREIRVLATALESATAAIAEREQQLRVATDQQELLIQEIHHRVKNNLQIVASLLNLQANRIRQPAARAEFQSARDRVRALATLHRHLYTQSELHAINMKGFLEELCGQLFQAMGEQRGRRITLDIAAPALRLSSDQAVPLALIVTEAVSNALKYAFPDGRSGHVSVRLTAATDMAELLIRDDGVGIPAGSAETETGPRDGLGLQLIRGFARQLGATLQVSEDGGTTYLVRLPLHRGGGLAAAAAGGMEVDPEPA